MHSTMHSTRHPECSRCKNQGLITPVKDHKHFCLWKDCECETERETVMAAQVALRSQQAQEMKMGLTCPMGLSDREVVVKTEPEVKGSAFQNHPIPLQLDPVSQMQPTPSSGLPLFPWAYGDGLADMPEASYYNCCQHPCYSTYYSNLYNYQPYELTHADSLVSSHIANYLTMHSYYPSNTYLTSSLGSTSYMSCTTENYNNCTDMTLRLQGVGAFSSDFGQEAALPAAASDVSGDAGATSEPPTVTVIDSTDED